MSRRSLVLLLVAALSVILVDGLWAWRRLEAAERERQQAAKDLLQRCRDLTALQSQAAGRRQAMVARPGDPIASIGRALRACGRGTLRSAEPLPERQLSSGPLREVGLKLSLSDLDLGSFGAFLAAWRAEDAAWSVIDMHVQPKPSGTWDITLSCMAVQPGALP